MMDWPTAAGGAAAIISISNLLVSALIKRDVAEVKLNVVEKLVQQDKETREWAEKEFAKKEVLDARLDALKAVRH